MNRWKREFDALIASQIMGRQVRMIYGASPLDVVDILDVTDADNPRQIDHYSVDEAAAIRAARQARQIGLCQAWSLAEGPNGMAGLFVRYDGSAVRALAQSAAQALAMGLVDIARRPQ